MSVSQLLRATFLGMAAAMLASLPVPVSAAPPATTAAPDSPEEEDTHAGDQRGPPVVNLNTASVEEISRLPGVGQRKAEAIVARRDKKKFTRPEEILQIKGIGRGIYKQCKPYLRVSGPTTLTEKVHLRGKSAK